MEIIKGDLLQALLDGEVGAIAHGCNCSNGFGSGVAGQIAKQFPIVKDIFHDNFKDNEGYQLGIIQPIRIPSSGYIINCYTQRNYGYDKNIKYLSYKAVDLCMIDLAKWACKKDTVIGLPKIGCGLAGGKWSKVKEIIEQRFKEHNAQYKIYVL